METAGAGKILTFGYFPKGKYERKTAGGGFFDIWAFPCMKIRRTTAGSGFLLTFGNFSGNTKGNRGGGNILTFGQIPIRKYKGFLGNVAGAQEYPFEVAGRPKPKENQYF